MFQQFQSNLWPPARTVQHWVVILCVNVYTVYVVVFLSTITAQTKAQNTVKEAVKTNLTQKCEWFNVAKMGPEYSNKLRLITRL